MNTLPTFVASSAIACMAIIGCNDSRETSQKNACINTLRQIEAAKEQWALEQSKEHGDQAIIMEVISYIKGGSPVCPIKGHYYYNEVGTDATCSKETEGHKLP